MNEQKSHSPTGQIKSSDHGRKIGVFVVVCAVIAVAYYQYADVLTLKSLAEKESQFREFRLENPVLVFGVAFAIYVAVTGLSLPFAAVLSLVFAWFFGFWRAVVLISFASTAGATVAFLLSRYLFRDAVQNRFSSHLVTINESLRREGAFYLFTLRLIPAIPFFVINLVMGLTPIRVSTYWWVSQLGMLPGTVVYVYAGSQFPDLKTLAEKGAGGILTVPLGIAFVLLGVFPLLVKKIMGQQSADKSTSD